MDQRRSQEIFCNFFRNVDADTLNTSLYTLDGADQSGMRYDITFISMDVTVLVLDMNRTGECDHIADVNDDGYLTLLDALMILQAASGASGIT
ncbi:MAG TPA: hypothetical protein ENF23_01720 [Methanosarcinales archaeon]|nr:MAG: hypothetical protein DRO03_05705 [Methanosarcinales archaeon]HDN65006.1 hypothetical protein [Methanosarcinales archaeon]